MKTRRYIIQKATGLLDDEPLEDKVANFLSIETTKEELSEQARYVVRTDLVHKVSNIVQLIEIAVLSKRWRVSLTNQTMFNR